MRINYFDLGVYEGRELSLMKDVILPSLGLTDYKLFGFEPTRDSYLGLLEKYEGQSDVHIIKAAVSNHNGVAPLYRAYKRRRYCPCGNSLFSSHNMVKGGEDFEEVECIVFSEWLSKNVPNYKNEFNILRVNIEGGEWHLFNDLKNNDLFKYINIVCGANPFEEMDRVGELQSYTPELKNMLEENNIKATTFIDIPDIDNLKIEIMNKIKKSRKNKNVVYTVIIGDWDELHEPNIITPGWDYVCFTDTDKTSDVWEIRKIEKDPSLSNRRISRKIELLYHHYLGEYETTIEVPGYAVINIDLNDIADLLGDSYDLVLLNHPRRKCTYDEIEYYISVTGDPMGQLAKQMEKYKREGLPDRLGLIASGMMVRRIGDKNVEKFCELWWEEVSNHSSNPQQSFMYIYWKYGLIRFYKWGFRYFNRYIRCGKHHAVSKEEVYKHLLD